MEGANVKKKTISQCCRINTAGNFLSLWS